MPRQIEIARDILGQARHPEARQNAVEIAPMQHIELAERSTAGADLFHRRLVFVAPGVCEGEPVERIAERLENNLCLTRDTGAEIDQRTEDVAEQSPHSRH